MSNDNVSIQIQRIQGTKESRNGSEVLLLVGQQHILGHAQT